MTFDCGLSLLFLMNRQRYRLITGPRRDAAGLETKTMEWRKRAICAPAALLLIVENRIGAEGRGTGGGREISLARSLVQVSGELELKESSNEIVCKPLSLPLSPSLSSGGRRIPGVP